jgi:hypothetical protein
LHFSFGNIELQAERRKGKLDIPLPHLLTRGSGFFFTMPGCYYNRAYRFDRSSSYQERKAKEIAYKFFLGKQDPIRRPLRMRLRRTRYDAGRGLAGFSQF